VSTEEQRKSGYSIPSQKRLLEEKMKADGVVAVHQPIDDVESGTTSERGGLKQLWELAKSGQIDVVYTFCLDRFGRHVVESPYLMYKLKEETGVIIRTMDREYDFTDPMDFLLAVIESYPGHVESRKIGERTQRGKVEKFRSGKWVGPVPFAYRKNASGELEKVREFEPIVRKIFENYKEKSDINKLASATDGLYSKTTGKFSADQIRRILTNPVYVGHPCYGNAKISAPQLSMVPTGLFENVQLLLERKMQKSKAKKKRKPRSFLDDLTSDYDTGSLISFLKQFKPHCPRCRTEMQGNGSKPSHVVEGARLPNFRCKCGYQRTIPNDAELEHLLTALSCPRCRYLSFDATTRLDSVTEYTCKRCRYSFMVRPEQCQQRIIFNDNSRYVPEHYSVASRNSEQDAGWWESLRCLVHRFAISGYSLESSAVEHFKEVNVRDVETIGDLIFTKLKKKNLPGGIITKQILMEVLSSPPPRIIEYP